MLSLLGRKLWGNFIFNIIVLNIFDIDMGEVKVVGEGIVIVEFVFDNVMWYGLGLVNIIFLILF